MSRFARRETSPSQPSPIGGGALAGFAACLLVLQYDVQPFVGLTFGPITFLICVPLGPTVGAAITILLTETLRISFDTAAVGWDNLVYGTLLVWFIIFLPQGLLGSVLARLTRREVVRHD